MSTFDLSAEQVVWGLVILAIGIIIGSLLTPQMASDQNGSSQSIPWVISGIALPIIVALISAYASTALNTAKKRQERIDREQEEWLVRTISILQQIYLECINLDRDRSVDDTNELNNIEDLISKLNKHYVEAPGEIDRDIVESVFEVQDKYRSHDSDNIIRYLRGEFSQNIDETMGIIGNRSKRVEEDNLPLYR